MEINSLRLLIIADDPLARAGLAALLANQPDCTVVGQIDSEINLPTDLDIYRPDILLWDLSWHPAPLLEHLSDSQSIGVPSVALLPDTAHAGEAWGTGVKGLLLRDANAEKLSAALLAASQGLITIDPELTTALLPNPQAPSSPPIEALTPREVEVLRHLAEGLSNKAIARHLDISGHTVKFHVNAIMTKLGAQSRTEAAVRATQLGLILL